MYLRGSGRGPEVLGRGRVRSSVVTEAEYNMASAAERTPSSGQKNPATLANPTRTMASHTQMIHVFGSDGDGGEHQSE
jgi:hypothetical protein